MKISKSVVISTVVFLLVSALCLVGNIKSGSSSYTDGTYKVSVQGRNAPIELEVVIKGGKPSAVNVLSQEESFFAEAAFTEIPAAFLKGKKVDSIDAVSGATITSEAIKEALKAALSQAAPAQ